MTFPRLLIALGIAVVLAILGLVAGAWWYLSAPNEIDSAELVPANTIFFASIPNGVKLLEGYETSHLKAIVENPNSKPIRDEVVNLIGAKNLDVIQSFLPNLSGQSFIAVTHYDDDNPDKVGLIAAMKPKAGFNDFAPFLDKLKATWPDVIKQGKTGTGTVEGIDYQWIQGPGAHDKICVANIKGWIVTSWGEASLQDWIERFEKKSTTSSLVKDSTYQKAIGRVGDDPSAVVYFNYQLVRGAAQKQIEKTYPASADYIAKKTEAIVGAAVGSRFESGEISDHFTLLIPRPVQLECGVPEHPCAFETLKFTGPDTHFYWATGVNWGQLYKHLKTVSGPSAYNQTSANPMANDVMGFVKSWVHTAGLDAQRNIVDAVGSEVSLQMEWTADNTYPEVGLIAKLDKPGDFKPTIDAIIESVRKAYATTGVVTEIASGGHKYATLQFVQTSPWTPTITEDGPYLGVFLTENQAVRAFQRDPTIGLTHRADFNTQMGDKRTPAAQILFLDTPYLLDRTYRMALPFIPMAGMFNKDVAAFIHGKTLPDDLSWLAPMDPWTCIVTPDEEGIQVYSISGIGNQGILLAAAAQPATTTLQSLGYLPKYEAKPQASPAPSTAPQPAVGTPSTPPTGVPATSIIFITNDSKIILDEVTIPENQIGDLLKSKKAANADLKLTVMVDRNALPEVLSKVMDAGAAAGFGELPYTYAPKQPSPATNSNSTVIPSPDAENAPSTNATPDSNSATPGPIQPH